ncbi:MAG: hypothetical protein H7338_25155 [Candidatus Sericytochromatia bacterium]|nr:hypothetical protein [Candidatus Sericytochromatia bacterium]
MALRRPLLQAVLLALCLSGCRPDVSPDEAAMPATRPTSMAPPANPDAGSTKSLELYSLQGTDGRWSYYLLSGTNRLKKLSEVVSSNPAVGAESFKTRLRALPPGSIISWSTQAINDRPNSRLILPDPETIRQIREVCRLSGLDLSMRT